MLNTPRKRAAPVPMRLPKPSVGDVWAPTVACWEDQHRTVLKVTEYGVQYRNTKGEVRFHPWEYWRNWQIYRRVILLHEAAQE